MFLHSQQSTITEWNVDPLGMSDLKLNQIKVPIKYLKSIL